VAASTGGREPCVRLGENLYTTTADGQFVSLNATTGEIIFTLELEDRTPGRVEILGNYALVPTSQGALYVLDTQTPLIYARFEAGDGFASVTVTAEGRVAALDNRGVVHGLTMRYTP
jgi:outer membrane protein assembly factor BamB